MLNYCDTAYITKVEADGGAQVFFPNLDKEEGWHLAHESETKESGGYKIKYTIYSRLKEARKCLR
jgi:dihydrofolate reductase